MATPHTKTTTPTQTEAGTSAALIRGRACYDRHEWNDAFEALSLADRSEALGADDLHRLAWSAGLTARDDEMLATQERVVVDDPRGGP